MKYMFPVIILICSVILSGCIKNDNDFSVNSTNQTQSIDTKPTIGITFMSGDIAMVYTNQKGIMGSILYPDQKNTIVLEGHGKGQIQADRIYHIPLLDGKLTLSGVDILYDSLFSFSGISNGSERNYTRNYIWSEKKYREDMSFMNRKTHEYVEITSVSQVRFSSKDRDVDNELEGLCEKNDDINPITQEEYRKIGTDKIYVAYQDTGDMDYKTTMICFKRKNNFYKLKRTDTHYRKDIVNSLTFL